MQRLALVLLLVSLVCSAQAAPPQSDLQSVATTPGTSTQSAIVVPAGTTVELALTSPILSKTAKAGENVYAQTAFPVAVNNQIAIPPGTYMEGQIDSLARPGWLSPHAQFQIHFTKIIFANGYTIVLPGPQNVSSQPPPTQPTSTAPEAPIVPADDVLAAVASPYVLVSSSNDVLLDNGSQLEMILQIPLSLLADRVATAARMSSLAQLPQFKSATLCRPTYGTPGSSDTVIPGSPGSPGTVCPGPPIVAPNPKADFKVSFQLRAAVQLAGKQLLAGMYQATWTGLAPSAQVDILQNGNLIVSVRARVVLLDRASSTDLAGIHTNSDGSISLQSLRFTGLSYALYFDHGGV